VKRNRAAIEEVREVYRRSGGVTPRLGLAELTALYESKLANVNSLDEFRAADLTIDVDAIVAPDARAKYLALPDAVSVRDREVPLEYDVEEGVGGVARLRLPEKLARTLAESELPELDRPLRFVVPRGQRGAVRAASLDELQELLERPWMADEIRVGGERHSGRGRDTHTRRRERAHDRGRSRGDARPGGKRSRRNRGHRDADPRRRRSR
jgi:hypothetical protein